MRLELGIPNHFKLVGGVNDFYLGVMPIRNAVILVLTGSFAKRRD